MHIERVQIEEGFLDGLDVSFSRGLNVVIGERGTGKTSLIELVRFCFGVDGYHFRIHETQPRPCAVCPRQWSGHHHSVRR